MPCLPYPPPCTGWHKHNSHTHGPCLPTPPHHDSPLPLRPALASASSPGQMEVRRQQVKQEILDDVESKKADMRLIGEEVRGWEGGGAGVPWDGWRGCV